MYQSEVAREEQQLTQEVQDFSDDDRQLFYKLIGYNPDEGVDTLTGAPVDVR